MSLVGFQSMAPTDHLNLKHENSPHSVSTISSPAGLNNFSPPTQTSTIGISNVPSSSSGGYQVHGVSPTEGSTANGYYHNGPGLPAASTSAPTANDMPMLTKAIEEDDFASIQIQPMMLHPCAPGTSSYSISPSKIPPITAIPNMLSSHGFHHVNSPTLVIRNPFDEDEPIRSPHSAPPIPQQPQPRLPTYHQIQAFCPDMCIVPQKLVEQGKRISYAWNTDRLPTPYPSDMSRSRQYPPFPYPPMINPMMPRFPGLFPGGIPGQPPQPPVPAPQPAKKTKKESKAAKAAANAAAAAAGATTPNFASPESMRPPSSASMPPPDVFKVPTLKSPQELKQRLQTPPNNANAIKSRSPQNRKPPYALNGFPERRCMSGQCDMCTFEITPLQQGIMCTGFGQGCHQLYHASCVMLDQEAFEMILSDSRYEWICSRCTEMNKFGAAYAM